MVLAKRGFILFALLLASAAGAELQIEINQGVENPTPIAVVPFAWQGVGSPPEDVAQIVDSDLARSGQFAPADRRELATASQIRIDNLSDIFRRRTYSLPGKRHHRNERGILHSLINFYLKLCAGCRCQQQRK